MDAQKIKEVYERLDILDERLGHKLRQRSATGHRLSQEQLEDRLRSVADFALELRELVRDLIVALASRPGADRPG